MSNCKTWEGNVYEELLSITPTNDFHAVFIDDEPYGAGTKRLITNRVDAIGIAKVCTYKYSHYEGWAFPEKELLSTQNEIVHLALENKYGGGWSIQEDAGNFAGVIRIGQHPRDGLYSCDRDDINALDPSEQPEDWN